MDVKCWLRNKYKGAKQLTVTSDCRSDSDTDGACYSSIYIVQLAVSRKQRQMPTPSGWPIRLHISVFFFVNIYSDMQSGRIH